MPLSFVPGSEAGTVDSMGLLMLLVKADCPVLRGRLSLPPLSGDISKDWLRQYIPRPQCICHMQNMQSFSPKRENWEELLKSDNLRIKQTHPHMPKMEQSQQNGLPQGDTKF